MVRPAPTVAVVFGTFPPARNGGADFVARFAPALAARGARVHVVTSRDNGAETERVAENVSVHRVIEDWSLAESGRAALRETNELLRTEGVQLVHVLFPDSVLQGRYQLPAALGLRDLPLVTTYWNLGLGRRSPLPIKLEAVSLLARSAVLTSHDPAYLDALRRIVVGRKPVQWLPVGSNIATEVNSPAETVRRKLGLRDGPLLGYFGQLDFTRGVEDLFAAVRSLRDRGTDATLVMIGGADSARCDRYSGLAGELGIAGSVEWTPYLGPQEAADLLASVDVCALPYRRNSLGRSALAASLELGVPTVLAGTGDGVAPLVPGRHIELVPPAAPAALTAAIANLLDDPARRQRLSEGAREAARLFAWPRVAEAALGVYRLALSRRCRRSRSGDPSAA